MTSLGHFTSPQILSIVAAISCKALLTSCSGSRLTSSTGTSSSTGKSSSNVQERDGVEFGKDVDLFPKQITEQICTRLFDCCSTRELEALDRIESASVEDCAAQSSLFGHAVGLLEVDQSLQAERVRFDSDKAQECVAAVAHLDCSKLRSDFSLLGMPGCGSVFVAQVDQGGECTHDHECKMGVCNQTEGGQGSTCQTMPEPGKTGEACSEGQCQVGHYCALLDGKCAPKKALGAECFQHKHCTSGFCLEGSDGKPVCGELDPICSGG